MASDSLKASEELSARGATAPRVSLDHMKSRVVAEHYLNVGAALDAMSLAHSHPSPAPDSPLHLMTLCTLVLDNGFVVLGKSAPASAANFDEEKGKTFAYEDAIKQLWPLMGFALRDHLTYGGGTWWAQPLEHFFDCA